MLLDMVGLDKQEKIMIQESIGNERDFQKVAEALVVQHPIIHVRESRKRLGERESGKGAGKSGIKKGDKFMS
eukprot:9520216-Karenia_brevis.AAC.1